MPEFSKTDLELSMTLDGSTITTTPSKGAYTISVICDKGATGYWDYDAWSVVVGNINEVKVKCVIAFQTGSPKFNEYIMAKSEVANSGVEKITHEVTEQTPALTDYRYVGANPNNYVCFGYDGVRCPDDNLYRIIGVIPTQSSENGIYENRVKLIKANYYTEEESGLSKENTSLDRKGYNWSNIKENKWENSDLQSKVLNEVYWNNLGNYQEYIAPAKWYLGAPYLPSYTTYTPKQFYSNERSSTPGYSKGIINYITNIGLIYPSDYGYSLKDNNQNLSIYENKENYMNNTWLYNLENKYFEWTITPESAYESKDLNGTAAWFITSDGYVYPNLINHVNYILSIRPTFYLKSSVQYTSGDGTIGNPYRIK